MAFDSSQTTEARAVSKGARVRQTASPDATADLFAWPGARKLTARELLDASQKEQAAHDEGYHRDILALALHQRMNHFSLHMCKYSGQVIEATDDGSQDQLAHLLTDSYIIALAAANALAMNLDAAIRAEPPGLINSRGEWVSPHRSDDKFWFAHRFAAISARLAKACESQDHQEKFPIHEVMRQCVLMFSRLILEEASVRRVDLVQSTRERWRAVERKIDVARQRASERALA